MRIEIKDFENKVKEIQEKENLSNRQIAEIMGLDYSYIFRIFKSEKNTYSSNVINGIERFCTHFNINSKNYIFLD